MPGTHHLTLRYRRRDTLREHRALIDRALQHHPPTHGGARHAGARSGEGDPARLRGIPAIGRGVGGAIPGTTPHRTIR